MRILASYDRQVRPMSAQVRTLSTRALRQRDEEAARQLGRLGVDAVQSLADGLPRRRHVAALMLHEALGQMEKAGTLPTLRGLRISETCLAGLLTDRRGIVRSVAVRIVGHSGDRIWITALTRVLKDERDPFVRGRVADALGYLAAVDAVPLLVGLVENPSEPARYHALRALGRLGRVAWGHLVRLAVDHPEDIVRRVAAETVARVADAAAWAALVGALAEASSPDVRRSAVEGFGRSRATRAADPIVRALLADDSPVVREAAADALATLGEPAAVSALADSALHDPFWVSDRGAVGTAAVDDPRGVSMGHRYPVREAAAEALVVLGGMQAWEELAATPEGHSALPDPFAVAGSR